MPLVELDTLICDISACVYNHSSTCTTVPTIKRLGIRSQTHTGCSKFKVRQDVREAETREPLPQDWGEFQHIIDYLEDTVERWR